MVYTRGFINSALSMFVTRDCYTGSILTSYVTLDNNRATKIFLNTVVDGKELEVPIMMKDAFELNMSYSTSVIDDNFPIVTLPLYVNSSSIEFRTFSTFFVTLASVPFATRLMCLHTNKGESYYISRGLILDSNYNPLMLCTLRARNIITSNSTIKIAYYRPIIYINPCIFNGPSNVVYKGIINKIIPYYTMQGTKFPFPNDSSFCNRMETNLITGKSLALVKIEDFSRFFTKPSVPIPQDNINDSLNDCLVKNTKDVLSQL